MARAGPRVVFLLAGSAFLALTAAALAGTVTAEAELRHALMAWPSPTVMEILRVLNRAGEWQVILPGTLILVAVFPRARARWWIWVSLMISAPLAETVVKELVGRTRPESLALGFPSGHVTAAAAFFAALSYLAEDLPSPVSRVVLRAAAGVIVLLVSLARIVLGAHWPSDTLAGVALGLALASAAAVTARHPEGAAHTPGREDG